MWFRCEGQASQCGQVPCKDLPARADFLMMLHAKYVISRKPCRPCSKAPRVIRHAFAALLDNASTHCALHPDTRPGLTMTLRATSCRFRHMIAAVRCRASRRHAVIVAIAALGSNHACGCQAQLAVLGGSPLPAHASRTFDCLAGADHACRLLVVAAPFFLVHLLQVVHHVREEFLQGSRGSASGAGWRRRRRICAPPYATFPAAVGAIKLRSRSS